MFKTLLLFFVFSCSLTTSHSKECSSTYVIVASKYIRPGLSYQVTAVIDNITEPVDVNLAIQRDGCNIAHQKVNFEAGTPKEIKLEVPADVTDGNYELLSFGSSTSGKFSFLHKSNLKFKEKSKSVFIQTDKGIYKTGQLVNYRIIVVNPDMKPVNCILNGHIADPSDNRIKIFQNITLNNGIYTGELQLSDQPPLGNWVIDVDIDGQHTNKVFGVQEYVLPKFEVTVDLPSMALMTDKEFTATVTAKYTFGKPISGKVKILFEGEYASFLIITYATLKNGIAKAKINMRDLLSSKIYFGDKTDLTVTAVVTEDLTGISQNGSGTVALHREKIQVEIIKSSQYFKPGLKYLLYIKVSMADNKNIPQNLKNKLHVSFSPNYMDGTDPTSTNLVFDVPANGKVVAEYYPADKLDYLYIKAQYGKIIARDTVQKFKSASNSYLQLIVNTDYPKVGDKIDFEVNSTIKMDSLNYVVLSRGTIVASEKLSLNNQNSAEFSIEATADFTPTARVLVYHARSDGEMVADAINVKVDGAIQNNVSIAFENAKSGKDFVEPGTLVKVYGNAAPNSFVGIAAVDQSVLLLSSANEITQNHILEEIDGYNKLDYYEPINKVFTFGRSGNKPIEASDSTQIFERSGVVVLTNSYVFSSMGNPPMHRPAAYGGMAGYRSKVAMTTTPPMFEMAQNSVMDSADGFKQSGFSATAPDAPPKTRKYFPETWLWLDINASSDGAFSNETIVPDSITSWVASAISVDSKLGIGVTTTPAKLRVFRPFFVSANLPFSVIRGETFTLQVIVFNYLGEDQEVDVSLEKSDLFQITNSSNNGFSTKIKVISETPTTVSIPITPLTVGDIDIKITAKCAKAGDAEKKQLLVKPEGVSLYFNSPIFIDLNQVNSFTQKVDLPSPTEGLVEGSERAEVSAIVDILGPTINHIGSLVRMPYGCGEQNMINFVPDVIIAKYLTAIDQFNEPIKGKVMRFIENGYQRQFTYQRFDGSFSAFGNRDEEGSTWLTAFVVKSFYQAMPFTYISVDSLKKALNWLDTKLTLENYYEERGKIIDKHIQSGVSGGVALTAYIVTAIADLQDYMKNGSILLKSVSYLEGKLDSITSPFELAITSYALAKSNSTVAEKAFDKLKTLAIKEDNMMHWTNPGDAKPSEFYPYKSSGEAIQATGYALLTYMLQKDVKEVLPIVKWLISQMTSVGGFQSTQDTVIGLEALAAFAEQTHSKDTDIVLTFSSAGFNQNFDLKSSEAILLHKAQIPTFPKSIEIKASGKGSTFAQVSWQYNVKSNSESAYFDLEISSNTSFFGFTLNACPKQKSDQILGMTVLEITMPSGYSADSSLFPEILEQQPEIGRIEGKNDDTTVFVYYNEINFSPAPCVTIEASRVHIIENLKEVPITLYSYYEPEKRVTKMYKTPEVSAATLPSGNDNGTCEAQCLQSCQ